MARLLLVIDKPREEVFEIVDGTVLKNPCNVQVDFGHISENGLHVAITGEEKDLTVLKGAFKENGQVATLFKNDESVAV